MLDPLTEGLIDLGNLFEQEAAASTAQGELLRAGPKIIAQEREAFDLATDFTPDRIPIIIITEGLGNEADKHYYGPEFIEAFRPMCEGLKCFLDHISQSEMQDRPERSVRDLCGFYTNARIIKVWNDEEARMVDGILSDLIPSSNEAGREVQALARQARIFHQLYPAAREVFCGTSIDAAGERQERTMQVGSRNLKVRYVLRPTVANSADIVTYPARGGDFVGSLDRIMQAKKDNPKEAQAMVSETAVREVAQFGSLLESARRSGDQSAVKKHLTEARARLHALCEAEECDPMDKGKGKEAETEEAKRKREADETEARKKREAEEAEAKRKKEAAADPDADGDTHEAKTRRLEKRLSEAEARIATYDAREACVKLLKEAGIPAEILTAEELAPLSEAERALWVKRGKQMVERAKVRGYQPGGTFPLGAGDAPSGGSIRESLRKSGIPTVAGKEA
ncbi:MAG TPA: hypothetical protein VNI57_01425 [Candidatus Saccharimonadales bacterium]|nr:hypothetical protein [Candidatus Saccharimonadales bacterium]